ncbi:MAG: GNAT family N-acetyltransferase [Phycisphaeraceae bacterium]|nr:GNAT family N-acetyltransferase [Phycisphaeraceae bacterium]
MTHAVRALGTHDAAAYLAVRRAMLDDSPWAYTASPGDDFAADVEGARAWLAKPENAIFACEPESEPGRLAAVAGVHRLARLKARHRALVWGVWCEPAFRGQGLGRAVVAAAVQRASQWPGVTIIGLSVSTRGGPARRLYESLGFEAWGVEPGGIVVNGEEVDEVYMTKRV